MFDIVHLFLCDLSLLILWNRPVLPVQHVVCDVYCSKIMKKLDLSCFFAEFQISASNISNNVICINVHCKKHPLTFSIITGVSWSFLYFFVPVERGMNSLQYTCLESWWHHNYVIVILHVTKVCFIELYFSTLNILSSELSFEDKTCEKPMKMWKVFCQKTDKKLYIKKLNIRRLSSKVANNRLHSRVAKQSATVISKCAALFR